MKVSNRIRLIAFGLVLCNLFALPLLLAAAPYEWDDAANQPPIAEAGMYRYAALNPIQLDGSGSYDPDISGPLSYSWIQVSGPPLAITGANTPKPTISGFVQKEEIQECEFQLVVNDGQIDSLPDTTRVVVVPRYTQCTMTLENAFFDPNKPTLLYFHGGTSEQTGGGKLNRPLWSEKANVISFPSYVGDPGTFSGAQTDKSYMRPGDMIIVYLSSVAPDYCQPIQTLGWSIGGLLALDVARRLNVTYGDARYAVNHACLLDPSAWVMGTPEFHRRIALLLENPVDGEQIWVASLEAANASASPSALNVVFIADHALPKDWYLNSLNGMEDTPFNHGVVAGAFWSILGPGRNLQLALTPEVQTYKFRWIGSATDGRMEMFDELNHPGRLPEPVTLVSWTNSSETLGDIDGVVFSCRLSENAAGYELLFGSDPYRIMDFRVVSDTTLTPTDAVVDFGPGDTWWTVRVRDQYGSTIHADPVPIDLTVLAPRTVQNSRTGRRYSLISLAILESEPGDTILLDPALYEENITFKVPLTLSSLYPSDPNVVAGTVVKGLDSESTVTFAGLESTGATLDGLTIQSETIGISCRDAVVTIRNCVVESPNGIAVEFWEDYEPVIMDCNIIGEILKLADPRIVAHWKLDETEGTSAYDYGGHNGTLNGGAIWQPTAGAIGGAIQLDGINDYISTPYVLSPATAGSFSVFAWIKSDTAGKVILSQKTGANWLLTNTSGKLVTELKAAGTSGKTLLSQAVITDGNWHRIGFVRDGTSRILYVDDVEVTRDTQTSLSGNINGLHIGAAKGLASSSYFSGMIDDVRIYNRVVVPLISPSRHISEPRDQ